MWESRVFCFMRPIRTADLQVRILFGRNQTLFWRFLREFSTFSKNILLTFDDKLTRNREINLLTVVHLLIALNPCFEHALYTFIFS